MNSERKPINCYRVRGVDLDVLVLAQSIHQATDCFEPTSPLVSVTLVGEVVSIAKAIIEKIPGIVDLGYKIVP